jgi:hypothetical protein
VGYFGIVHSDNHSITYNDIYYGLGRTVAVWIVAQLPRLVVYVTGPSPALLAADGEQGCCVLKRRPVGHGR